MNSGEMRDGDAIPNGPGAAAILSTGIGCFALGVLSTLSDAFPAVSNRLTFYGPTGDLSGVTTTAIVIWLVVWVILGRRWSNRQVAIARINVAALALLALGVLLTFPPFMDLLQGK